MFETAETARRQAVPACLQIAEPQILEGMKQKKSPNWVTARKMAWNSLEIICNDVRSNVVAHRVFRACEGVDRGGGSGGAVMAAVEYIKQLSGAQLPSPLSQRCRFSFVCCCGSKAKILTIRSFAHNIRRQCTLNDNVRRDVHAAHTERLAFVSVRGSGHYCGIQIIIFS